MNKQKLFSHIENHHASMVDISEKAPSARSASAQAFLQIPLKILGMLKKGQASPKGPILETAFIAGTMAAKKTSELIPLCHGLNLSSVKFEHELKNSGLLLWCHVKCQGPTGVEMEALTGVSVAALTVYDMCKALSKEIIIGDIRLLSKSGGKNDF